MAYEIIGSAGPNSVSAMAAKRIFRDKRSVVQSLRRRGFFCVAARTRRANDSPGVRAGHRGRELGIIPL
jgi:hypothetical protein